MTRMLAFVVLAGAAYAYFYAPLGLHTQSPKNVERKVARPLPQQSCSDDCDQMGVVEQQPDDVVRACKARCTDAEPQRRREPPRSISVAPADHSSKITDARR